MGQRSGGCQPTGSAEGGTAGNWPRRLPSLSSATELSGLTRLWLLGRVPGAGGPKTPSQVLDMPLPVLPAPRFRSCILLGYRDLTKPFWNGISSYSAKSGANRAGANNPSCMDTHGSQVGQRFAERLCKGLAAFYVVHRTWLSKTRAQQAVQDHARGDAG
jgi:hypothetical protein